MAGEIVIDLLTGQPVPTRRAAGAVARLRTVMGVKTPTGWRQIDGVGIAWQAVDWKPAATHTVNRTSDNCSGETALGKAAPEEALKSESPNAARPGNPVLQPILCLHDAGSGGREFRPLVEHVPAGCRLILIDWPGHGRSGDLKVEQHFTVEKCVLQLRELADQLALDYSGRGYFGRDTPKLGDRQPIIIGSGFGAAVAVRYAADYPVQVKALVLCEPSWMFASDEIVLRETTGPSSRSTDRESRAGKGVSAAKALSLWSKAPTHNPAYWQAMRLEILKAGVGAEQLKAKAEASLSRSRKELNAALRVIPGTTEWARAVSCPILFALSRDHRHASRRSYRAMLDRLLRAAPGHRLTIFSGSFHPLWDEPVRFAQVLNGFVQAQLPLAEHRHAWLLAAPDWPTRDLNLWKCVHPECTAEVALEAGNNANDVPESALNV